MNKMSLLINMKIAFRGMLKNKTQSLISVVGLGIGLGCIFLISLLYLHESSFDQYIPQNQYVYRIIHGDDCRTPFPLGEIAAAEIPSIDAYFRYYQNAEFEIKNKQNEIVKERNFACVDQSVFNCFGIDLVSGTQARAFNEVVISEQMAKKYFKNGLAVNQVIEARISNDFINLTVCGVYKDFPSNATLSPNFISHPDLIDEFFGNRKQLLGEFGDDSNGLKSNWNKSFFHTYIRINSKADAFVVAEQLQKFGKLFEDKSKQEQAFRLQAVNNVYLGSADIGGDIFSRRGNANELKYYIAIALFILLIAVFNYIFLSKAKLDGRLKEIGAKKTLGAPASSILKQLLLESNLISLISIIPALFVVSFGMPFINNTLGRTLDSNVLLLWYTIPLLLLITLLTGSLSGFIVGINISRVSPVLLLNKKTSTRPKASKWANSFLSLHFVIFMILIVGVLTLKKQIHFALTNFQAINTENIIIGELNDEGLRNQFNIIENEINKLPGVVTTAGSSFIPPFNWFLPVRLKYEEEQVRFDGLIMGAGMIDLLGIQLIEGEAFGEYKTNPREMIFNESAALKYKLKAGEIFNGFYVKGIVKDFSGHSLHKLIEPMVILQQHPNKMGLFAVKTDGTNDAYITSTLQQLLKEIAPDKITNIYTLSDQINQFYTQEQNQAMLISAFSILAIVLSIMGLLGMTLNVATRKTKEIGIRKVNGAKVSEILAMLNKDFVKWVAIAFVIATPIAYYAMNKWLENFAYKTELSWWIFALAGVLALGIALLTVSLQSWRAATRNPVESLRYE